MATALTAWYPLVAPHVPGCPIPVMLDYIRRTIRDFCEKTHLWGDNQLAPISIVANTPTYALTSASGEIVGIDAANINGTPLYPIRISMLNAFLPDWRQTTEALPQYYFISENADTVRLIYTPSASISSGLNVVVSLKPLAAATSVEDFLWDYQECIRDGTVSRLLLVSNMPWSNLQMAAVFRQDYDMAIINARIKKDTGRTDTDPTIRPELEMSAYSRPETDKNER